MKHPLPVYYRQSVPPPTEQQAREALARDLARRDTGLARRLLSTRLFEVAMSGQAGVKR
jgi:hypothetical protein